MFSLSSLLDRIYSENSIRPTKRLAGCRRFQYSESFAYANSFISGCKKKKRTAASLPDKKGISKKRKERKGL